MKLKKYEASSEKEAIEMVKNELGMEALIVNVKKIKPKGIFSFFKKSYVEVTAAYEDKPFIKIDEKNIQSNNRENNNTRTNSVRNSNQEFIENIKIKEQELTIKELEKKLNDTKGVLEKILKKYTVSEMGKYNNETLEVLYENLVNQGVNEKLVNDLFDDIINVEDLDKLEVNLIVKIVYNKIINIIGNPHQVKFDKNSPTAKNIVFIGPTGVGKTTTIAKLSSYFIINKGANISFITADTYRIAAVEQLKTYAEILECDVGVVYTTDDLTENIEKMRFINDMIFVDTAGRSHKNNENLKELKKFLDVIPEPEIYLVLSLNTKYEDLIDIVSAYSQITDFSIIFTKLDETSCLGSVLNICYESGKSVSYLSNGQNVPDDFEVAEPEKIAKLLLGSMYI